MEASSIKRSSPSVISRGSEFINVKSITLYVVGVLAGIAAIALYLSGVVSGSAAIAIGVGGSGFILGGFLCNKFGSCADSSLEKVDSPKKKIVPIQIAKASKVAGSEIDPLAASKESSPSSSTLSSKDGSPSLQAAASLGLDSAAISRRHASASIASSRASSPPPPSTSAAVGDQSTLSALPELASQHQAIASTDSQVAAAPPAVSAISVSSRGSSSPPPPASAAVGDQSTLSAPHEPASLHHAIASADSQVAGAPPAISALLASPANPPPDAASKKESPTNALGAAPALSNGGSVPRLAAPIPRLGLVATISAITREAAPQRTPLAASRPSSRRSSMDATASQTSSVVQSPQKGGATEFREKLKNLAAVGSIKEFVKKYKNYFEHRNQQGNTCFLHAVVKCCEANLSHNESIYKKLITVLRALAEENADVLAVNKYTQENALQFVLKFQKSKGVSMPNLVRFLRGLKIPE